MSVYMTEKNDRHMYIFSKKTEVSCLDDSICGVVYILTSPYANFEASFKPFVTSMKAGKSDATSNPTVFSGHVHLCQDNRFAVSTWNIELSLQARVDRALSLSTVFSSTSF